ncbi:monosaccharide ABC transporter ATP-binding protein (CUT2 family) [Panacagrimonas perspica]|uniref:Monosaccharide ABC transporter ATP-binding protein (CUT2 family) n=1 Tax=Panacagrimonas perspica TaxID=381431 RepID=A0A4V3UR72_9GAMM|nr:sugar ABC transporter ATP-binding protein [Panacagrimonas perspica]TDU31056.1 monosaccharide ABC transporter ATP-binding protein (CUT2 family) [Panacagrimonas perspica]THD01801.1 ABC transporter ATP-binding protein [Panacagrimonas perspica]
MNATNPPESGTVILRVENGSKMYAGVHALQDVGFDVRAGEIHALVGENGAGKSTLCKSIAGAIRLSSGRMSVDGQSVNFQRPGDALRAGVCMVYQETSLVPSMTVAQNLELGRERLITRLRPLNIKAQQQLQSLNFHVDPTVLVATLGTAQRQMVEIARAAYHDARIIIFDEPTASLTPEEKVHFFYLLRDLRAKGLGIVFISHALEEALELADRITVLRDGRHVVTQDASTLTREDLVRHMVGRDVQATHYGRRAGSDAKGKREKVLTVENLTMGNIVKNMSFTLYAGEVVGIAGLIGSGRTESAKIVSGALKRNLIGGGSVYLRGRPVRYDVPKQAIDDGIVYITEDRKLNGFFETMTVEENIHLGSLATKKGFRWFVSGRQRRELAGALAARLKVRAVSAGAKIIELSGGNQQKVVVAKSLIQEPAVVFFDEPTRGVDVGAIPEIHQAIRQLADEGKAVVVISSYLPEVLAVSDRILVARQGRIVEEFSAADASEDRIMFAAIH